MKTIRYSLAVYLIFFREGYPFDLQSYAALAMGIGCQSLIEEGSKRMTNPANDAPQKWSISFELAHTGLKPFLDFLNVLDIPLVQGIHLDPK